MKNTPANSAPKLQSPGAGLPLIELAVLRIVFRLKRFRFKRQKLTDVFATERTEIVRLAKQCKDGMGERPVLIDRIRGIEDSSRNWSVYMTIEHLLIVNSEIMAIIALLQDGRVPEGTVSIADVKPPSDADASTMVRFESNCDDYIAMANTAESLNSKLTHPHPWIGKMNALDWHALAARHMSIHRTQIEKIIAGL